MGLEFNKQNWNECLQSLGFTEQLNPNGKACYDIYDENGIPRWQYETMETKKHLYSFFCGMIYMKLKINLGGKQYV